MLIPLKENTEVEALALSHFPTRQQAVVWRNWERVPVERLARVLETSKENVLELASQLGLVCPPKVDERWLDRGYITIIRANWHLLTFEQLLTLLNWTAEKLSFTLKEDDFLWIKLGSLKPAVKPAVYQPLSAEELRRTEQLRHTIHRHFPVTKEDGVKPFDFLDKLKAEETSNHQRRKWLSTAATDEVILNHTWTIVYPQATEYVEDFVTRFVEKHAGKWGVRPKASTKATDNYNMHLQIRPDPYSISESHTIVIDHDDIHISAVDEVGLLRGLQWIERQMEERGAPYLQRKAVSRKTRFDLRYVYSYFAVYGDPLLDPELDPYPDELLSRLSDLGINGIWLQAVLYNLIPWEQAPELSEHWEKRIEGLRRLVERAGRYGIGVYLYYNEPRAMPLSFFEKYPEWQGHTEKEQAALCTSQKEVQHYIKNGAARLFQEVPKLAGLFTITMSENLTNCYSRAPGGKTNCPRCSVREPHEVVAEVNRLIAEGVHSVNPKAEILCWTWGYTEGHNLDQNKIKEAIGQFPDHVRVMCTSEEGKLTNIAGIEGHVVDYSISVVGPSEKSRKSWQAAKKRGLSQAAKVQLNTTWECSAVPYLPVMNLIEQHLNNLSDSGVSALMLSWTLGGYPSLNLEFASQYYWEQDHEIPYKADHLAARIFGEDVSEGIKQAWQAFSKAFQAFPFHVGVVYNAPQNVGPANLLYEKPTGYQATMVGFPYDDLDRWRSIYPADEFEEQFRKLSVGWQQGVKLLKQAETEVKDSNYAAFLDLKHVSEAAYIHFRSTYLQIAFVRLRGRLEQTANREARNKTVDKLLNIIDEEIRLTKTLHGICRKDSRIGYEASNQYYYTTQDLREKVLNCEYIREVMEAKRG